MIRWFSPTENEYDRVLEAFEHDFHHRPGYLSLEAERLGGRPELLYIEGRGYRACVPLIIRSWGEHEDLSSGYGYGGPLVEAAKKEDAARAGEALTEALRARGFLSAFLRQHPLFEVKESIGAGPQRVVHGPTVWIDLRTGYDAAFAGFRATHRNLIRRLRREGYSLIGPAPWSRLPEFEALYAGTMRRLGAGEDYFFGSAYFAGLRRALGDSLSLWLVEKDGKSCAAALIVRTGGLVQYHLSASDPAHRKLSPTRLLLDGVTRWAAHEGAERFFLGGGLGAREDSLFRFKAGFSSARSEFATWRLIPDRDAYARACDAAGVSAEESFFPAYRASRSMPEGGGE